MALARASERYGIFGVFCKLFFAFLWVAFFLFTVVEGLFYCPPLLFSALLLFFVAEIVFLHVFSTAFNVFRRFVYRIALQATSFILSLVPLCKGLSIIYAARN